MRERINTIAVAIPAQQFHVLCHASIEHQVPVMTDIAVRLLHMSGPMEPKVLGAYFGLGMAQLAELVALLREEGLAAETEGRLSLTSYAEARFAESDDGLPRFTKIVERQSRPVFDLLSYSPLPSSVRARAVDNPLELPGARGRSGKTINQAEAAFHRHFEDIERMEQPDPSRRARSCYKVDSIVAGQPYSIPLPVHFDVTMDGDIEFDIDGSLELLPQELRSNVRLLTAERIATLVPPKATVGAFADDFNDTLLRRFLPAKSEAVSTGSRAIRVVRGVDGRMAFERPADLDFARYVREVHAEEDGAAYDDGASRALLGAIYLPKNIERLVQRLERVLERPDSAAEPPPATAFWVVPDNELWGRTDLLRESVDKLKSAFFKGKKEPLKLIALVPAGTDQKPEVLRRIASPFRSAGFSAVHFAQRAERISQREALVFPGRVGVAMQHWRPPRADVLSVPLGFLTGHKPKLARLAQLVLDCAKSTHAVCGDVGADSSVPLWSVLSAAERTPVALRDVLAVEPFARP